MASFVRALARPRTAFFYLVGREFQLGAGREGTASDRPHDRSARPPAPPGRPRSAPASGCLAWFINGVRRGDAGRGGPLLVRRARGRAALRRPARPRRGSRSGTRLQSSAYAFLPSRLAIPTPRLRSRSLRPPRPRRRSTGWRRCESAPDGPILRGARGVAGSGSRGPGAPSSPTGLRSPRRRRRHRLRQGARRPRRAGRAASSSSLLGGRIRGDARDAPRSTHATRQLLSSPRRIGSGPLGTGMLLAMLGLAILWLDPAPLSPSSGCGGAAATTSRHMGYFDAVFGDWVALGAAFVLGLRGAARRDGARAPPSARGRASPAPPSSPRPTCPLSLPLHRPRAARRSPRSSRATTDSSAPTLCAGSRLRVESVGGERVPRSGAGPSRRVVPLGHVARRPFLAARGGRRPRPRAGHHSSSDHIAKAIGWFALFALPGALVLMLATRRVGGMGNPRAVPSRYLSRPPGASSRDPRAEASAPEHAEAEADWKALQDDERTAGHARGLPRVAP